MSEELVGWERGGRSRISQTAVSKSTINWSAVQKDPIPVPTNSSRTISMQLSVGNDSKPNNYRVYLASLMNTKSQQLSYMTSIQRKEQSPQPAAEEFKFVNK